MRNEDINFINECLDVLDQTEVLTEFQLKMPTFPLLSGIGEGLGVAKNAIGSVAKLGYNVVAPNLRWLKSSNAIKKQGENEFYSGLDKQLGRVHQNKIDAVQKELNNYKGDSLGEEQIKSKDALEKTLSDLKSNKNARDIISRNIKELEIANSENINNYGKLQLSDTSVVGKNAENMIKQSTDDLADMRKSLDAFDNDMTKNPNAIIVDKSKLDITDAKISKFFANTNLKNVSDFTDTNDIKVHKLLNNIYNKDVVHKDDIVSLYKILKDPTKLNDYITHDNNLNSDSLGKLFTNYKNTVGEADNYGVLKRSVDFGADSARTGAGLWALSNVSDSVRNSKIGDAVNFIRDKRSKADDYYSTESPDYIRGPYNAVANPTGNIHTVYDKITSAYDVASDTAKNVYDNASKYVSDLLGPNKKQ